MEKSNPWTAWKKNKARNPFANMPTVPDPINGQILAFELPDRESVTESGLIVPTSSDERALPKAVVLKVSDGVKNISKGDCIIFGHHTANKIGSWGHLLIPSNCVLFVGEAPEECADA